MFLAKTGIFFGQAKQRVTGESLDLLKILALQAKLLG